MSVSLSQRVHFVCPSTTRSPTNTLRSIGPNSTKALGTRPSGCATHSPQVVRRACWEELDHACTSQTVFPIRTVEEPDAHRIQVEPEGTIQQPAAGIEEMERNDAGNQICSCIALYPGSWKAGNSSRWAPDSFTTQTLLFMGPTTKRQKVQTFV